MSEKSKCVAHNALPLSFNGLFGGSRAHESAFYGSALAIGGLYIR